MDQAQLQLLDKMTTLYSWSRDCLDHLKEIVCKPDVFHDQIGRLEELLKRSKEDDPLPEAKAELTTSDCYDFYLKAVASTPLFNLLRSEPLFSTSPIDQIATFVNFVDIRPHPRTMLHTQDTTFMRILAEVERQGKVSVKKMMIDDLNKLIVFDHEYPQVSERLRELCETDRWRPELVAVEAELETGSSRTGAGGLGPGGAGERILKLIRDPELPAARASKLQKDFLASPRFSTMLREETQLYFDVRDNLPKAESLFAKELFDIASQEEKYLRIAAETIDLLPGQGRALVESSLNLRQEAARYFLDLRKFAKLDALDYKWPVLGRQLRLNESRLLEELESHILEPQLSPAEAPESWRRWLQDEQLVRFLRLRPHFRLIGPEEKKEYIAVSQAVAKPPSPQEAAAAIQQVEIESAPFKSPQAAYENLVFQIEQAQDKPDTYQIKLKDDPDLNSEFELPLDVIEETQAGLNQVIYSRADGRQSLAGGGDADPSTFIKELGTQIYELVFKKDRTLHDMFVAKMKGSRPVRIVIETKETRLMLLPWECLYVPPLRVFPALAQKFSVVRLIPDSSSLIPRSLTPPLRVMVVTANPKDAGYIETDQEKEMIKQTLATAVQSGQAELKILEHATPSDLLQALRVFEPHLFHFIGHGTYIKDIDQGALLLEDERNRAKPLPDSDLKTLLVDYNINMAILNGCETGTTSTRNVITGVAGTLVENGIPAVIATMRAVIDAAALMFTREFYRSLMDGYNLETSITEARKALSIDKWDWPAYALFSGTTELDDFRLLSSHRRKENPVIPG